MTQQLPPMFDKLSPQDRASALERFQRVDVDFGVRLMDVGDEDPTAIIVVTGELEVRTGASRVGRLTAGEVAGEGALFGERPHTAIVESTVPSELLLIERSAYLDLCEKNHPMAFLLEQAAIECLARRLRRTDADIHDRAAGTELGSLVPHPGFFERVRALFAGAGASLIPARADIAESPLFRGLDPAAVSEVAAATKTERWSRGDFLTTEGSDSEGFIFLTAGTVEVIVMTAYADRFEAVATLHPGDAFGAGTLLGWRRRSASCVAREDVVVAVLDRDTGQALVRAATPAGRALRVATIRALSEQLAFADAQIAALDRERLDRRLSDLQPLLRASGGLESHGRYLQAMTGATPADQGAGQRARS